MSGQRPHYGQGTVGTAYPMLQRLAELQIGAENDHFCCGVVLDTESAFKINILQCGPT